MRKNLLSSFRLRVVMLVAILCSAFTGTVWGADIVVTLDNIGAGLTSQANTTAATTSITATGTTDSYTLNYYQCKKQTSGSNSAMFMTKSVNAYISNKTAMPGNIKSVEVFIMSGAAKATTYDCAFSTTECTSAVSGIGSVNITGGNSHTFSNLSGGSINVKGEYFCITLGNANNGQVLKLVITCQEKGGADLTPNDLSLNVSEKVFDLKDGDNQTFQLTNSGSADGALSYESNNTDVATVSNSGLITAVGEGTATITVTQAATSTYEGGSATCTVTVTDSRYTISNLTFTAACGGSGTANDGAVWTVTSDATESNFDSNRGIHYGTGSAAVSYITLSTNDINGTIKKIVVNAAGASGTSAELNVTVGGNAFGSEQSVSSSATDYTFTGSDNGEVIVTLSQQSAQSALYVKSVKVYYIPSTDPVIVASNPDELDYNATNGSISYSITNSVSGGALNASVPNGSWITIGAINDSSVAFTCTANEENTSRSETVTLTYSYGNNETVTKDVTVTQAGDPNALLTISEVRAQETGSNVHTKGIVTSVNGKTAYIQDSGAAIVVYGSSDLTCVLGDEIEVTGTLTTYSGLLEITNPTVTVLSQSNTVTPEVMTIAQVNASTKQGWLVKIENATVSAIDNHNVTIAQEDNTVGVYFNSAPSGFAVNDIITLTGNIGCHNNVQIANPTDISVTGSVTPTYTISWTAGEHTELFVFDASDETVPLNSGVSVAAGTTINVSVSADSGYTLLPLAVKDASSTDISLTEISEGYYSFEMPASNVTITSSALAQGTYSFTPNNAFYGTNNTYSGNSTANPSSLSGTSNGITVVYSKGSQNNFYVSTEQTRTYKGSTMTFSVPDGFALLSISFTADGTNWAGTHTANSGTMTDNKNWKGYAREVTITFGGTCRITSIEATFANTRPSEITSNGYSTWIPLKNVEVPSTVSAYIVTNTSTDKVKLEELLAIPAGTPVILKGNEGSYTFAECDASDCDDVSANLLTIGDGKAFGSGEYPYVLAKNNGSACFKQWTGASATLLGRVVLVLDEAVAASRSIFMLDDSETTTGIDNINVNLDDNKVYDLQGRRVAQPKKGLFIANGKKVIK